MDRQFEDGLEIRKQVMGAPPAVDAFRAAHEVVREAPAE